MPETRQPSFYSIKNLWPLFLMLSVMLIIWSAFSYALYYNLYIGNEEKSGQLGDTLGIINSLFSGLAFAGLFYTILLQKKELHETKQEFIQQNKTLKQQRFETTFFNLISVQHELLNTLTYVNGRDTYMGKSIFDQLRDRLHEILGKVYVSDLNHGNLEQQYQNLYNLNTNIFSSYFSNLLTLIKFVDNADLNYSEKAFYISLLISQFTQNEKLVIYYHITLSNKATPLNRDLMIIMRKYKVDEELSQYVLNVTHERLLNYPTFPEI